MVRHGRHIDMATGAFTSVLPNWISFDERILRCGMVDLETMVCDRNFGVIDARATELSEFGCRLEVGYKMTVGTCVTVGLTAFLAVAGWVAWVGRDAVGIEFAHRLPDAVVAAIVGSKWVAS